MTTLKEKILFRLKRQMNCKIENCQGCEHETNAIMSEIAAYTKRVVGGDEGDYRTDDDVPYNEGLTEKNLRTEQYQRAKEEGVIV